jgi:V-type H+-transporting ATPase subunit a
LVVDFHPFELKFLSPDPGNAILVSDPDCGTRHLLILPYRSGRYIVLLMGAFSLYTGLLYNDLFSKSMRLWSSGWEFRGNGTAVSTGRVYPIGVDPAWNGSDNALIFTNSYKMKMSIILGVIHVGYYCTVVCASRTEVILQQMTFATCLQIPNHIHFNKWSNIWTDFVPQVLFLHSIFGYLVFCIIFKWCKDWTVATTAPPNLLNMLIAMFLTPGSINEKELLFPGQVGVQVFLLLLAGVCIPWMLCVKPYLIWKEMKRVEAQGYRAVQDDSNGISHRRSLDGDEERAEAGIIADEEHVSSYIPLIERMIC